MSRKSYIGDSYEGAYANIEINDNTYQFTLDDVKPEARQWLVDVLETHMQEVHDRSRNHTISEFQKTARDLFGL